MMMMRGVIARDDGSSYSFQVYIRADLSLPRAASYLISNNARISDFSFLGIILAMWYVLDCVNELEAVGVNGSHGNTCLVFYIYWD